MEIQHDRDDEMPIEMVWSLSHDDTFDGKQFASALVERAKENLEQDGYVQPGVFLVTATEVLGYSVSFSGYEEKEATYGEVVRKARELNARAIVTLNDAFIGDKHHEDYEWGQIGKDPKGECVFVTVSGPELENWTKEIEYRRGPDGIVFAQPAEERNSFIGILGDWSRKGQRVN